jgi:lysozyme family protein
MTFSKRFLAFLPWLYKWEGKVFENDPDDPGGATKFGIDQRSHPAVNIRDLTEEQADEIYSEEWNSDNCERLPFPLGEVYFNACVNVGKYRADQLMAKTRSAGTFLDAQQAFYERLAEAKPKSAKYLKGWTNRTNDLRKFLKIA